MSSVYWIHHPEHTDMFSQGYIGVSKDLKKRWSDHAKRTGNTHLLHAIKKYGWDSLVKEVVLVADEAYCLMIEAKLRVEDKIGWNITKGGGMPPLTKWNLGKNLSNETKAKISINRKGKKHTKEMQEFITQNNLIIAGQNTRFKQGQQPWNKGIQMGKEATKHLHTELTCPHCNKHGMLGGMKRWHMNNCKQKGIENG